MNASEAGFCYLKFFGSEGFKINLNHGGYVIDSFVKGISLPSDCAFQPKRGFVYPPVPILTL